MTAVTPRIVTAYFDAAPQADLAPYLALFAADAIVEDEGKTYRGVQEIRQWRSEVPQVSYDITDVSTAGDGAVVVTCTITGEFPGSPFAGLRFHFLDFSDTAIRRLRIAP
jgi:predicted ester cyclase